MAGQRIIRVTGGRRSGTGWRYPPVPRYNFVCIGIQYTYIPVPEFLTLCDKSHVRAVYIIILYTRIYNIIVIVIHGRMVYGMWYVCSTIRRTVYYIIIAGGDFRAETGLYTGEFRPRRFTSFSRPSSLK